MINELIEQFIKEDYEEFKIALTHSSFVNENNDKNIQSNERLEYLGDSVISYAVSNYLYHTYPTIAEGELSKIRSEIVNQKSLSEFWQQFHSGIEIILLLYTSGFGSYLGSYPASSSISMTSSISFWLELLFQCCMAK